MLTLLVFSAAMMGTIIFGYPVYLVINKEIKPALKILLFTFLSIILLVGLAVLTFLIFR
jgi:hypothetical protein